MSRTWFCRPIGILLALLLLPPEMATWTASPLFTASAQSGSHPGGRLFPKWSLQGFEDDMVIDYLKVHGLPASDAKYVYQFGRSDLRNEIRAHVMTYLLGVLGKPSNLWSTEGGNGWSEASVGALFRDRLFLEERRIYDVAIAERNKWRANACAYQVDAQLAEQFGMRLVDPACQRVYFTLTVPSAPSKEYLLAVGLKQVYGALIPTPEVTSIATSTSQRLGTAAFVGLGIGGVAGVLTAAVVSSTAALIMPYTGITLTTGWALGSGAAIAGPAAVVLFAVLIGAMYIVNWVNDDQNLANIAGLEAERAALVIDPGFINQSSTLSKLSYLLANDSTGDVPSTIALPSRENRDALFTISDLTTGAPTTTSPTLRYLDAPGQIWIAEPVLGGWFASRREDGTASSFSPTLDVKDATQAKFISRQNLTFGVSKQAPALGDIVCKVDSSGVTPGNVSPCAVYAAKTVALYGGNSHMLGVGLAPSPYPVFELPLTFRTTQGMAQTFTVRATAPATPIVSLVNISPSGFNFTPGPGGAATIEVQAGVPAGRYSIYLQAKNGAATSYQFVQVDVETEFEFTTPSTIQCFKGIPCEVRLATTAGPNVELSYPTSGLYGFSSDAPGTFKAYLLCDDSFTNTQGQGVGYFCTNSFRVTATPKFGAPKTNRFDVVYAPTPPVSFELSGDGVFNGGEWSDFRFKAIGSQAIQSASSCPGKNPAWLSIGGTTLPPAGFQLAGTPPRAYGPSQTIPVYVQYSFLHSSQASPVRGCAAPAFHITLNNRVKPQCVLPDNTPVGACRTVFDESWAQSMSKVVAYNVPVQPKLLNAPDWLSVSVSGTTMSFTGRPPEGSAGVYDVKVDYGDGVPQNVHVLVARAVGHPVKVRNVINGRQNTVKIPVDCFPRYSTKAVPPAIPSGGATILSVDSTTTDFNFTASDGAGTGFRDGNVAITYTPRRTGVFGGSVLVGCYDPQFPDLHGSQAVSVGFTFRSVDLQDVSNSIAVSYSGVTYNRAASQYSTFVTVRNTGSGMTPGNVYVFLKPGAGVEILNQAGTALENIPYFTTGKALAAGESVRIPVIYTKPGEQPLAFTAFSMSGLLP
jgi:hypothetical protein